MLRIIHKQAECIGCGLCAEVAPNYWKMDEEGLAKLLTIKKVHKSFEYAEGFEEDREILEEATKGCPVQIIEVHG